MRNLQRQPKPFIMKVLIYKVLRCIMGSLTECFRNKSLRLEQVIIGLRPDFIFYNFSISWGYRACALEIVFVPLRYPWGIWWLSHHGKTASKKICLQSSSCTGNGEACIVVQTSHVGGWINGSYGYSSGTTVRDLPSVQGVGMSFPSSIWISQSER